VVGSSHFISIIVSFGKIPLIIKIKNKTKK